MSYSLGLKWGTLKSWDLTNENQTAKDLLWRYEEIGSSISAMMQHDTPEQKEILCQLIDAVQGDIYLYWDRKIVSKDEAKKYIHEYGE